MNQLYLSNKLGYNRYFASSESYLKIKFSNLVKTISHELAHYLQFVKYGKSSCKSELGTSEYIEWLAKEHKKFSQQINQMIRSSEEYSKWEIN